MKKVEKNGNKFAFRGIPMFIVYVVENIFLGSWPILFNPIHMAEKKVFYYYLHKGF